MASLEKAHWIQDLTDKVSSDRCGGVDTPCRGRAGQTLERELEARLCAWASGERHRQVSRAGPGPSGRRPRDTGTGWLAFQSALFRAA